MTNEDRPKRNKLVEIPDHKRHTRLIDLRLIETAAFQPPTRTDEAAIAALLKEIAANGIQSSPHVIPVGDHFVLVDGHRRCACLRKLQITIVSCVIHELDQRWIYPLWVALNSATRKTTSLEWMHVWFHRKGDEGHLPGPTIAQIKACERHFDGREGIAYLLDHRVSPRIGPLCARALVALGRISHKAPVPKAIEILRWMVDHRGYEVLHHVASGNASANAMRMFTNRVRMGKAMTLAEAFGKGKQVKDGS